MPTRTTGYALAALSFSALANAISLSNFTPRTDNLPSACQSAYTTTIQGCSSSDFGSGNRCSSSCVQGLVAVAQLVTQQCAAANVPDSSIIGVFLAGNGIPALCPGVSVTTISSSSSTTSTTSTSAQASSAIVLSSAAAQSSTTSTTTSAEASSKTQSPASKSSAQVAMSATKEPAIVASTSKPPAASKSASTQKSNKDSGGGSPFDVVATGGADAVAQAQRGLMAMLALCLGMGLVI